jgi:hypothetical protein
MVLVVHIQLFPLRDVARGDGGQACERRTLGVKRHRLGSPLVVEPYAFAHGIDLPREYGPDVKAIQVLLSTEYLVQNEANGSKYRETSMRYLADKRHF